MTRAIVAFAFALALAACSGPQRPVAHDMRPLPESRALEVILEAFDRMSIRPELQRRIHLTATKDMEIDVSTAGKDHGVEYLQSQDRADFGDSLPQRRNPCALQTCVGVGEHSEHDVLLLDDQDYQYERDPRNADATHPTQLEVEDRLRRNVVDYLTYLRDHGQL